MEKITQPTLQNLGNLALEGIRDYLSGIPRDAGTEITLQSNDFQVTLSVNLFDEMSLFLKIFPHKNVTRENVFRFEVFMAKSGDNRGRRIAVIELPKGDDISRDVKSFLEGVLTRSGFQRAE
jgi:hypothetical protein